MVGMGARFGRAGGSAAAEGMAGTSVFAGGAPGWSIFPQDWRQSPGWAGVTSTFAMPVGVFSPAAGGPFTPESATLVGAEAPGAGRPFQVEGSSRLNEGVLAAGP